MPRRRRPRGPHLRADRHRPAIRRAVPGVAIEKREVRPWRARVEATQGEGRQAGIKRHSAGVVRAIGHVCFSSPDRAPLLLNEPSGVIRTPTPLPARPALRPVSPQVRWRRPCPSKSSVGSSRPCVFQLPAAAPGTCLSGGLPRGRQAPARTWPSATAGTPGLAAVAPVSEPAMTAAAGESRCRAAARRVWASFSLASRFSPPFRGSRLRFLSSARRLPRTKM